MPTDVDKQVRAKAGLVISGAYPTATVYPWNALSHDLGDWPGLFRMTAGGTHGWIIKRASGSAEWKSISRDRQSVAYDVWGFYGYRTGKLGDNSDDEFAVIWEAVYAAFKAAPTLNFDGTVEKHDLLQLANLTTINCGEETLHFAQGRLSVLLCC